MLLGSLSYGQDMEKAEQGDAKAQYEVGFMYYFGDDEGEIDKEKAFVWLKKSAEQGYADAQYILGFMYENGDGTSTNQAEAIRWYKKSAEQGHKKAQEKLKEMK